MHQHPQEKKLSLHARGDSLSYAIQGIVAFFRAEPNAILHLVATIIVSVLLFILPMSNVEIICIIVVMTMVWVAELINTAIERLADMITTEKNHSIKFIKDVAAGAVLVSAVAALITGIIIFMPKLTTLWN